MALTATFEEAWESRSIDIGRKSYSQNFVFFICGNFYEEAQIDPSYGPDDDIVATQYAYSIIPPFRYMPIYDDSNAFLYLTLDKIGLTRINQDVWRVEVAYSVPDTEDGGNQGPNQGDPEWSQDFVQLDFNVTTAEEEKKMSLATLACQRKFGAAGGVPYGPGLSAPIGQTEDGVAGTSVLARQFEFGIQGYFLPQKLTFQYVRKLYRMSGTLNNDTFYGFPAYSVLFTECSASGSLYDKVPINFNFKMKPNFKFSRTEPTKLVDPQEDDVKLMFDVFNDPFFENADTGPAPGDAYSGWDLVDYRYYAAEQEGMLLNKPVLRTIHQVYSISNFHLFDF